MFVLSIADVWIQKKRESIRTSAAFLKNPHLRVLFIFLIFVSLLSFLLFLFTRRYSNTFSNLIPENFYL